MAGDNAPRDNLYTRLDGTVVDYNTGQVHLLDGSITDINGQQLYGPGSSSLLGPGKKFTSGTVNPGAVKVGETKTPDEKDGEKEPTPLERLAALIPGLYALPSVPRPPTPPRPINPALGAPAFPTVAERTSVFGGFLNNDVAPRPSTIRRK